MKRKSLLMIWLFILYFFGLMGCSIDEQGRRVFVGPGYGIQKSIKEAKPIYHPPLVDELSHNTNAEDWEIGIDAYKGGDYKTALRKIGPLAYQGYAKAQAAMGTMYRKGQGVVQSDAEAVRWYRLSAEQGNPDAQTMLGIMYAQGKGVQQDFTQAQTWINLAASQGNENAQALRDGMFAAMAEAQKPDIHGVASGEKDQLTKRGGAKKF